MNSDFSISLADREKYVKGLDDVKQSWGIILMTIPGSIPLKPTFGSNLYQYIDKPVNASFSDMANTIIQDLEFWEKRTKISRVERTINGSQILLNIYGIYTPTNDIVKSTIDIIESAGGIGRMIIDSTFIIN